MKEQVPQCRKSLAKEVIPVCFKTYPKIHLKKWCILFREKKAKKKKEHTLAKVIKNNNFFSPSLSPFSMCVFCR